jgi:NAD-dependent deacetylase
MPGVRRLTIWESMDKRISQVADLLRAARYAVALTGAGVSTASGIPDFRSPGSGLWEQVDPYEVASLDGFRRRPAAYFAWVRPMARLIRDAQPNPAHLALAELERRSLLKAIITQNIDGLHQTAGSQVVLELHGSHREATCLKCLQILPASRYMQQVIETGEVPHCECGGVLKPNTVLFGEMLPVGTFHRAEQAVGRCDLMLVAGTSLEVAPASNLPELALRHGAGLVIVNRQRTALDSRAAVVIHDDVTRVLPAVAQALTGEGA